MALADGEVVGVVRGRDFDGAGAELGFGPVVGEDGDFAVGLPLVSVRGTRTFLPMRCGVALVVGVYGYGGVAEHGLGARGGDGDVSRCRRRRGSGCGRACRARSSCSTSRSETAVWMLGSQLTM